MHIQWEKNQTWNEMFSVAVKMYSNTTEHWWMKAKQKVPMLLLSLNPFKSQELVLITGLKKNYGGSFKLKHSVYCNSESIDHFRERQTF